MSVKELEDEIKEIEKVKERFRSGSLEWNNIESIIRDKKKELSRLKTQVDGEEDDVIIGCGGDCGGCGGGR